MPVTNETILTLKLNLQQINIVLTSLGEAPYKIVNDLINDVRQQIVPQIQQDDNIQTFMRPGA